MMLHNVLSVLSGLEKVLISPWLVTLLHICGVIPTPQLPISPETPRWYRRIEWRVFHDISQCFKSVSRCFTSGSHCTTMFYMCFMTFYYVYNVLWCLACRAMIGVAASTTTRPPIAWGISTVPQGSAITQQKSAMAAQPAGIVDIATNVIPC